MEVEVPLAAFPGNKSQLETVKKWLHGMINKKHDPGEK